ncbi:MAG: hypothetical protein ACYDBH_04470, partial [Acidobacteriaceae bacterium]
MGRRESAGRYAIRKTTELRTTLSGRGFFGAPAAPGKRDGGAAVRPGRPRRRIAHPAVPETIRLR